MGHFRVLYLKQEKKRTSFQSFCEKHSMKSLLVQQPVSWRSVLSTHPPRVGGRAQGDITVLYMELHE